MSNPTKTRLILFSALLIVLAGAAVFILTRLNNERTGSAAIVDADNYFDGSTPVDPPRELSDFTLIATTGEPMRLSDLQGQIVLLYFGYTHCPDICPITLGQFKQVKQALGDDADNVAFLMISVDGERDTPEALGRYMANFDPAFIGMSGEADVLSRVGADYGLFYEIHDSGLVDHTASIFMIDPQMRLDTIFTYGTEPDVMTEHVRRLLS